MKGIGLISIYYQNKLIPNLFFLFFVLVLFSCNSKDSVDKNLEAVSSEGLILITENSDTLFRLFEQKCNKEIFIDALKVNISERTKIPYSENSEYSFVVNSHDSIKQIYINQFFQKAEEEMTHIQADNLLKFYEFLLVSTGSIYGAYKIISSINGADEKKLIQIFSDIGFNQIESIRKGKKLFSFKKTDSFRKIRGKFFFFAVGASLYESYNILSKEKTNPQMKLKEMTIVVVKN
jgi:hypothetical protein